MACLTSYAVQAADVTTGKVGCFFYDQPHWQATGQFKAIGPVFETLTEFYANVFPVSDDWEGYRPHGYCRPTRQEITDAGFDPDA
jgi:hypothetical protein